VLFGIVLLLIVGLLIRLNPFVSVSAGHKGVVTLFGKVDPAGLDEGLHVVNPFASVTDVSVRIQKADAEGDAASRDLQQVTTHITLNYHINPSTVPAFWQAIGPGYVDTIITPEVQETFKAVTARYTAEELITKREEVRAQIRDTLNQKVNELTHGGLVMDEFSITNFAFSHSFNAAIEAKQEAEQLALKAKRDLDRIQVEAQQKIAMAEAEAASLKAQKQEITPDLIRLREIEVQREAILKWDGHLPNVNSGAVPFINIGSQAH
ncbi:MAG TPA: prohibitin family protein, partial [Nevskiaceae bacterium]|nr:prohibitin family protein [Nevskiaceae bacterium]